MARVRALALSASIAAMLFYSLAHAAKAPAETAPSVTEIKGLMQEAMGKRTPLRTLWGQMETRYGTKALPPLLKILQSEAERDELRWASLFGVARFAGKRSYGLLKKYSEHKSWLMRDASLRVMAALGASELRPSVERALKDKALVVRTTAVDVIGHMKLKASAPLLVEALFDPANYRKDHPLWIHSHILGVLRGFKYEAAMPRLVELLEAKKDSKLQAQVVATLETITGKNFGEKPIHEQIYLWKRHATSEKVF